MGTTDNPFHEDIMSSAGCGANTRLFMADWLILNNKMYTACDDMQLLRSWKTNVRDVTCKLS